MRESERKEPLAKEKLTPASGQKHCLYLSLFVGKKKVSDVVTDCVTLFHHIFLCLRREAIHKLIYQNGKTDRIVRTEQIDILQIER